MTGMLRRAVGKVLLRVGWDPGRGKRVEPAMVMSAPSPQNALDAFKGEWISAPPPSLPGLVAGGLGLFSDERLAWAIEQAGGVEGLRVLELGPLEGGHGYMLQERGAREVIAIEGNQRCYLKCLVMKEVAHLDRVRFLLGNFVEYLRDTPERFDLCLAAGVLYHMAQPLELIHLVSRVADRVYIWTHYYDAAIVKRTPSAPHFSGEHELSFGGFTCTGHRYEYYLGKRAAKYAGGLLAHSHWLTRDDLLGFLRHVGYTTIDVAFEDREHVHGPCLSLVARR